MKTKKRLLGLMVFGLVGATSFATYTQKNSSYRVPVYGQINFSAHSLNGQIEMEWSRFNEGVADSFKYYKVIRSSSNNNPVYPDDGYIKYSSDINFTKYRADSKSGYYRVCAITKEMNRYCSNVVWVDGEKIGNYKNTDSTYKQKYKKTEYERPIKSTGGISSEVQQKLDQWLKKLYLKLKNSNLSTNQKVSKIDEINVALKKISQSRSVFIPLVNYLDPKLAKMQSEFKQGDLSDLDSLLEGLLD